MTAPTMPAGWKLAWEVKPPVKGDADYPEWRRLLPAMIEYQQALIDATDVAPALEPTSYSNGHERIEPEWEPQSDTEPGEVTVEGLARRKSPQPWTL